MEPQQKSIKLTLAGQSQPGAISLGAEPTEVPVSLTSSPTTQQELTALSTNAVAPENRLVLTLEGINYDRPPAGNYEVYLNLPEGVTPDYKSDHYVGNLGMFGFGPRGHAGQQSQHAGGNVAFDITSVVRKLHAAGKWHPDKAKVTLVPTRVTPPGPGAPPGAPPAGAQARLDRIRIVPE